MNIFPNIHDSFGYRFPSRVKNFDSTHVHINRHAIFLKINYFFNYFLRGLTATRSEAVCNYSYIIFV